MVNNECTTHLECWDDQLPCEKVKETLHSVQSTMPKHQWHSQHWYWGRYPACYSISWAWAWKGMGDHRIHCCLMIAAIGCDLASSGSHTEDLLCLTCIPCPCQHLEHLVHDVMCRSCCRFLLWAVLPLQSILLTSRHFQSIQACVKDEEL